MRKEHKSKTGGLTPDFTGAFMLAPSFLLK